MKPRCLTRRSFLADTGWGFTGLALGAMLFRDGVARGATGHAAPDGKPHFPPKAKSVIWIFCCGGVSHVDSFDPKPALNKYAGKTYAETPFYKDLTDPERLKKVREVGDKGMPPKVVPTERLMEMMTGYRKWGRSGLEIADCWEHTASCADDLAIVRSLWCTDNDH